MAAAEAVDIDLYADDISHDFNSQEDFLVEGIDLFDDVVTNCSAGRLDAGDGGAESSPSTISSNVGSKINDTNDGKEGGQPLRKHQAYVGNLTWWTSDKDIHDTLQSIGVQDFVDVKFFENRANGQSKGYCVLTVGSENSLKVIHEKLPKKEIHGQLPIVTPPTKQALNQFEAQSKTRPVPCNQGNGGNMNMMGPRGPMGPHMGMAFGPRIMGPMMRGGPRGPPIGGLPHRNMIPQQGPPGIYNSQQRLPMGPQSLPPLPGPPQRPPPGMNVPQSMPPRGPPMHAPMMDARGPPPRDWNRPPMNTYHPQPPPAPHMNPAFFNPPGCASGSPTEQSPATNYSPLPERSRDAPAMTEADFEDVMSRNRTVSSSAISRAVADAAAGEFASAIETLVTAISLIKQSKVAGDNRCKVLVSSLHDTLQGIENKSYGRRERSRSRERERHRRSRRNRSRSRERDYRDRSRDRYDYYSRDCSRSPREREYRERRERYFYDERDRYHKIERECDRERTRTSGDCGKEHPERSEMHRIARR